MTSESSNHGKVRVDRDGDVVELVLAAPPLNLFDAAMGASIEQGLAEVSALVRAGQARAVLFRAEGKVFCGGVDVHEFQGLSTVDGANLMARFLTMTRTLESLPVPVIAAVHELNLTIGLELCLGCDLLLAAEEARFGLVEPHVGLTPGAGGTQRMVARAGIARASEFVLTGDLYGAAELREWGVVNRVYAAGELLPKARELATRLAAGPTVALGIGKQLLRTARDHGVAAADAITPAATGQVFATEDIATGITSLLENGPFKATFAGR